MDTGGWPLTKKSVGRLTTCTAAEKSICRLSKSTRAVKTRRRSPRVNVTLPAALLIALGFECVNGFHDTANAVAAVIYTHSMEPINAVVLSGL